MNNWTSTHNNATVVHTITELDAVDPDTTDYLLGLFSETHVQYEDKRDMSKDPSLVDMVRKTLQVTDASMTNAYGKSLSQVLVFADFKEESQWILPHGGEWPY